MSLILGGRLDWYKSYDGSFNDPLPRNPINRIYPEKSWYEFCPKFGVLYHLGEKTTLRTSIGKGFQAPSIPRLYMRMIRGDRIFEGNPELKSESLWSYELGVDRQITLGLLSKLTLYHSKGIDFIALRTIGTTTHLGRVWEVRRSENISKVQMQGVEAELNFITIAGIPELSASLGYSYNQSKIIEDKANPLTEGKDLVFMPRNKFVFSITYDNPRLVTITPRLKYTDKMYSNIENTKLLDDYWTVDINISRKLSKNIEIKFDCKNLFDVKYDIPTGIAELVAPGRIITGSLNVKF